MTLLNSTVLFQNKQTQKDPYERLSKIQFKKALQPVMNNENATITSKARAS